MIQIGGMGVVTFAVAITVASGKKLGLMQRSTMQEAISAHQMGGIRPAVDFGNFGTLRDFFRFSHDCYTFLYGNSNNLNRDA